MAIRLVAVDVDGTLVTADQRVLPRVQAAAQRAAEHGIQLVLCTGRAPGECWYILDALPQVRYAVTQTGAIAQDLKTGETLYHCPLSPDDARLIYSHVRRYDGFVNFFSGGIVYNARRQMAQFERYYPAGTQNELDAVLCGAPPISAGCSSGRTSLSTIWTPWSPDGTGPWKSSTCRFPAGKNVKRPWPI